MDSNTTPVATLVTTPVFRTDDKIIQIVRSTPNITREEIGKICGISINGVRYYIDKLRKAGRLEWEGNSRTGRWVIKKKS